MSSPAAVAVEDRLFQALAVLRGVVLVNAVAVTIWRRDDFDRPGLVVAAVLVMTLWTGFATWAYAEHRRRTLPLLVADLALAAGLLLLTPAVQADDVTASLPGFWVMGALFAWAIHYRWVGGLVAGALLAGADLVRQDVDWSDYDNAFLLVLGGTVVGFMCGSLERMAAEREVAERAAAVAEERTRLARAVHDGVLQVLALVQRRGGDLGPLAGEQERRLRALIRAQATVAPVAEGAVDLVAELTALERRAGVTVSTPATPVEMPAPTARELAAVAGACLDNVRAHVGDAAPAWVLLQAFPDRVELTVRDDGPGIAAGRLEEAAAEGRLGVAESIRGRIADLGGTAELTTGSLGTEWEFVVPRVT